jgi:hypothetical protein
MFIWTFLSCFFGVMLTSNNILFQVLSGSISFSFDHPIKFKTNGTIPLGVFSVWIPSNLLVSLLSYKATFSLSQRWPLNTGLTVIIIRRKPIVISVVSTKPQDDCRVPGDILPNRKQKDEQLNKISTIRATRKPTLPEYTSKCTGNNKNINTN